MPIETPRSLGEYFRSRQNNFNLIRLVAALTVIYGHSYAVVSAKGGADFFTRLIGWSFSGGVAVDTFFVISGFLVTASAMKGNWRRYIAARLLRIYPGLLLCATLLAFGLGALLTTSSGYLQLPEVWRFWWHNGFAIKTEYFLPGVFTGMPDAAIDGVLWSIVIEVRLYILVLVLQLAGVFRRPALFNTLVIAALTLGYLMVDVLSARASSAELRVEALYLLGMFCWVNRDRLPLNEFVLPALLAACAMAKNTDRFVVPYCLTVTYSVFLFAFAPGFGWFRRVGDYSYGVYLYGWPVQQCLVLWDRQIPAWRNALLGCVISLAIGMLSWHFFEKPVLSLKERFSGGLGL